MSFLVRLIFVNIYIISVYSKRVDLAFITDSQFMYLDLYIQFRNYDFILVCYNNTYSLITAHDSQTNDIYDNIWFPFLQDEYSRLLFLIDKILINTMLNTREMDYLKRKKHSFIYVVTQHTEPLIEPNLDLELLIRSASEKHVQITFITPSSSIQQSLVSSDDTIFRLTHATGGMFLPIHNFIASPLINYIKDDFIHKRITVDAALFNQTIYQPSLMHDFSVDTRMKDYSITIFGESAELLSITNNKNNESIQLYPVKMSNTVEVNFANYTSQGPHTVYFTCEGNCGITIRADAEIRFVPMFSAVSSPVADRWSFQCRAGKSFLAILLDSPYKNLDILTVKIYSQKQWAEVLNLEKVSDDFYVSNTAVLIPDDLISFNIYGELRENDSLQKIEREYPQMFLPRAMDDEETEKGPIQNLIKKTLIIIKDRRTKINCDKQRSNNGPVRWYKNGSFLMEGKLTLNGSVQDSGVYTCWDLISKKEYKYNVSVCLPPQFLHPEVLTVSQKNILHCEVSSSDGIKVTWKKNDVEMAVKETILYANYPGTYICEISSNCGNVSRKFKVVGNCCALNVERDFNATKPFVTHAKGGKFYSIYNTLTDAVFVEEGHSVRFFCNTNGILSYDGESLGQNYKLAVCKKDSNFKVDDVVMDFKKLNCETILEKQVDEDYFVCGHHRRITRVNYIFNNMSVTLYETCMFKDLKTPSYVRSKLNKARANKEMAANEGSPQNQMFFCEEDDKCCFAPRQLLNERDTYPGSAPFATFSYYNIVPDCGMSNWAELEKRVRKLSNYCNTESGLVIWNGVIHNVNLRKSLKSNITDGYNGVPTVRARSGVIPSPRFLFKVVQDLKNRRGVAFIQVNVPNVTTKEQARQHVLCVDICHEIKWLGDGDWQNPGRGYIYCCSIREFNILFFNIVIIKQAEEIFREI